MTALTPASKASRKGSGCCGASSGGGCDCGQAGVCRLDNFKRPRFFAGQLLTAEDLDLIDAYVVGKNRLHNRFLFGEGVVCGLTVTCHPCGGGVVRIAPGYALDCCGNDIYVPCPEEVDVNALARDLRIRKLAGYDCGDACADRRASSGHARSRQQGSAGEEGENEAEGTGGKSGEAGEAARNHYCLYIRYHETSTDPVAPYASDEPCGPADCQASRICEGYAFEVRCTDDRTVPEDVFDRICRCVGDLEEAAKVVSRARVASLYAVETATAIARLPEKITLDPKDVKAAQESVAALGALVERAASDETRTREAVAHLLRAAVTVARYRALDSEQRKAMEETASQIQDISNTLETTRGPLRDLIEKNVSDARSRDYAFAVLEQSQHYTAEERGSQNFISTEARLFANGVVASKPVVQGFSRDLGALKDWLLERLERSTTQTSCDLVRQVRRAVVPDATTDLEFALRQQQRLSATLGYALLEYFKDCVCLALNPSCPPCEDPAVLLACLTVEDCEVVDICNLDRTFVLSPMAMRYWLPPLKWLGTLFEKFCCEFDFRPAPKDPQPIDRQLEPTNNFLVVSGRLQTPLGEAPTEAASLLDRVGISARDANATAVILASLLGLARITVIGEEATRLARMTAEVRSLKRPLDEVIAQPEEKGHEK